MRRREFIAALGGAAAWPLVARAQQPVIPTVGFLAGGFEKALGPIIEAYKRGLLDTGYIEGKNVTIEYRFANTQYDQLPALAADLVRHQVAVIAPVNPLAALAAKHATTSSPLSLVSAATQSEMGSLQASTGLVETSPVPPSLVICFLRSV